MVVAARRQFHYLDAAVYEAASVDWRGPGLGAAMRWYFREEDLMREPHLAQLFLAMKTQLELDPLRLIWIVDKDRVDTSKIGRSKVGVNAARAAMGIDQAELRQAIPPAYAEFIGVALKVL
jgi:hypothetical protein